ncbi:dTDP-4-dehydrorhamnose reductase family protein [Roseococcus pinisoli]|uniref:dTDP-4-dehydrorhamnose reductase n=1 Tax=Roseococcus pinisoli TaxID=2835040 RepID=A0ABS5Q977_9PROT|nr:SDR family oxidoreductase [Roseococcus pinisoli]MBS7810270.1 SDR family oxidoreductase [Roseococcus pinisoli]
MRVLVLGASGMLGQAMYSVLSAHRGLEVSGTLRSEGSRRLFPAALQASLVAGVDALDIDALAACLAERRPDVVINCVGLVKQLQEAEDPLRALPINALLPHRLSRLCALAGARLIQISTDCVFRGDRGSYTEDDESDATDFYGRSKLLGEVDAPHAVTLRTSIIGRELASRHGLVEWFLAQTGQVRGFTRAIFSGLTTDALADVVAQHLLPKPELRGVWHVAAAPIAKHELLLMLREVYERDVEIVPDDTLRIDRSLDGGRFRAATGFVARPWPEMLRQMRMRSLRP